MLSGRKVLWLRSLIAVKRPPGFVSIVSVSDPKPSYCERSPPDQYDRGRSLLPLEDAMFSRP